MNLVMQSGLGRPIDPSFVSNRFVLIGTAVVGLVALVVQWITPGSIDLLAAGAIAVAVFLAWAIARELDPDDNRSAAVALGVGAVAALLGPPAAAVTAIVLLAARVMAGTVGARLRPADVIVLTLAAGYAGTRAEAWGGALFLVAAIVVARPKRAPFIAAAIGVAALGTGMLTDAAPATGALSTTSVALLGLTVLAAATSIPVRRVTSRTDLGDAPIDPRRVTAARIGTAFSVVIGGLLVADGGAVALTPAIAAVVGVASRRLTSLPASGPAHATPPPPNRKSGTPP